MEVAALYATLGVDDSEYQAKMARAESRLESVRRTAVTVVATLASVGAALGIRELADYADTWTLVEGRLKLVTGSSEELERVQSRLFDIAQDSRTAFESVADLYTRVARNADQLGRSQAEVLDFTELVNKAIQTSGESASTSAAGVMQLTQALSSGELRGEEFRSVIENLTGVSLVLQRALGVTVGELREMAFAGELTSDVIIGAVLEMRQSIEQDFAGLPRTIGQAMVQMRNNVLREVGTMSRELGVGSAVASGIAAIGENIGALVSAVQLATAALAGRFLVALTATAGQKIQSARSSHALAQAERAQAAASLEAARASEVQAAAQIKSLEATRAAIALSRQEAIASLQRNQAMLGRAATVPIESLRPLGAAAVEREMLRRQMATQAVSQATRELGILGQQQARINQQLATAQMGVAAASGVAEARQNALAAATSRASLMSRAAAASSAMLSRALAFLSGPWGIALSALAIGFFTMRTRTDEAADSMERARDAANSLRSSLSDLTKQEAEATKAAAQLAIAQTRAQIATLEAERAAETITGKGGKARIPRSVTTWDGGGLGVPSREQVDEVANSVSELDGQIDQLNVALSAQQGILDAATGALYRYNRAGQVDSKAFDRIMAQLREQQIEFERGERAALEYALSLDKDLTPAQRRLILAQHDLTEAARRASEQREEQLRSVTDFTQRVADLNGELRIEYVRLTQGAEAARRAQLAEEGITGALADQIIEREHVNDALREAAEERKKQQKELEEAAEAARKSLEDQSRSMADNMFDAAASIVTSTRTAGDAVRDMVNRMIADLLRPIYERNIRQGLASLFEPLIGWLGGSVTGGPGTPGPSTANVVVDPSFSRASEASVTHVHMSVPISVQALDSKTAFELILEQKGAVSQALLEAVNSSDSLRAALTRG